MHPYRRRLASKTESREIINKLYAERKITHPVPSSSHPIHIDSTILEVSESEVFAENTSQAETDRSFMAAWCVKHNISDAAANELLGFLSTKLDYFPKDVRTLKNTPTDAPITTLSDGEYVHYGLKDTLTDFIRQYQPTSKILELNINVDGLPISKSSKKCIWPILININDTDFVSAVGIFCGNSHPKDTRNFLMPFVDELNELLSNNLYYNDNMFEVKCRAFICDAPARALILGTKTHSGYSCCTKCTQRGERKSNRIIFQFESHPSRTDIEFRTRKDLYHHNELNATALENLPIDMVKHFPLDYMHVVCLGVVKRLFSSWCRFYCRTKNLPYSLGGAKINNMNSKFISIRHQIPREFCSKTRDLSELERYKATEYRLFLLYVGPIVLKDILDGERYEHFLLLSLALRILLHPLDCKKNNECATHLLKDFVKETSNLYSELKLTYNFHCLLHLAADANQFGSLETISAFKSEIHLGKFKTFLKKKNQVAQQLYNRLVERSLHLPTQTKKQKQLGKMKNGSFTFVRVKTFYLSTSSPDNFYSENNFVYQLKSIVKTDSNEIKLNGARVLQLNELFVKPLKSSYFDIYHTEQLILGEIESHYIHEINFKFIHFHNFALDHHSFVPIQSSHGEPR